MDKNLVCRTGPENGNTAPVAPAKLANRQGAHLYFIKIAKGRSPVKVGRANDPFERLKNLQVGSPYELKLLGVLDNCGEDEFEFHRALSGHRIRGEWFSWSKHVETTVRLALDGGDWRSAKDPDRRQMDEKWWVDSPLYADAPKLRGGSHG